MKLSDASIYEISNQYIKMPACSCYMGDLFDRTKNCLNVQDSLTANKSLVETKKNV